MTKQLLKAAGALIILAAAILSGAEFPQAQISNGQIQAKLYLPDAAKGFYRAARFDWSGVIYSLVYRGHDFFTQWWQRADPKVNDFIYDGDNVVAGPRSANVGPVEEFVDALGYEQAKVGGTFIKVGIGALRKQTDAPTYARSGPFEVVDPGKWTIRKTATSVEFTQELNHPESGFAYVYRKTIRLAKGSPGLIMEHSLRNTGRHPIKNSVYNHNFLRIDNLPTSPDYVITAPFTIKEGESPTPPPQVGGVQMKPEHPRGPSTPGTYEVRKNQIVYLRELKGDEHVGFPVLGFGPDPKDYDIHMENRRLGVGMRIICDRPLSRLLLWSIRQVVTVEPYVDISVDPGKEFSWTNTYTFYTLPK